MVLFSRSLSGVCAQPLRITEMLASKDNNKNVLNVKFFSEDVMPEDFRVHFQEHDTQ